MFYINKINFKRILLKIIELCLWAVYFSGLIYIALCCGYMYFYVQSSNLLVNIFLYLVSILDLLAFMWGWIGFGLEFSFQNHYWER